MFIHDPLLYKITLQKQSILWARSSVATEQSSISPVTVRIPGCVFVQPVFKGCIQKRLVYSCLWPFLHIMIIRDPTARSCVKTLSWFVCSCISVFFIIQLHKCVLGKLIVNQLLGPPWGAESFWNCLFFPSETACLGQDRSINQ